VVPFLQTDSGSNATPSPTSHARLRYLLALVVAGLLVYAVVVASGGIRDSVRQLRHASPVWLIPALVLEIASYGAAGWLLWLLRGDNDSIRWGTTVRVALVMWGLGSLLPAAPAEGIALWVSELGRRGVGRHGAIAMLLVAGWCQFWALVLTTAVAAAVVDAIGHPDPDDAGGLWIALHATHAHVDFGVVVLAYVAGTVASWVPLLPGGLGAVEIAVPAVLHHFGVPLSVALAGTLLWRGLSLFLPAAGGALAYASLRAARPVAST
jgi:uncharacterized membrane protein YbhN (UPF0104 family)